MARILKEDETGLPSASGDNPALRLKAYIQTNWTIIDPPVSDIYWDTYWFGKGLIAIKFVELQTNPSPMVCGWGKWTYISNVQAILQAWQEKNGDYSTVITKARNRIEDLVNGDVGAMNSYGISAMSITGFNPKYSSSETDRYKEDTTILAITVQFIYSKTVVVV